MIQSSHILWRPKHKGISIFKVPSGNSEFKTNWRIKLAAVVNRDRVVDATLRERTKNKWIFICHQHFRNDQYHVHETCKTSIPGEIPEWNLLVKSILSTKPIPRPPAVRISIQKQISSPPSTSTIASSCYKSFEEFKKRIELLKLPPCWEMAHISSEETVFKWFDTVHSIPKHEIHANVI